MSRFLQPQIDSGAHIDPMDIASGPSLWLRADAHKCGTNGARSFPGTDEALEFDDHIDPGTSDFFITLWVNVDNTAADKMIFWTGASAENEPGVVIFAQDDEKVKVGVRDSEEYPAARTDGVVTDAALTEAWHHLAFNFDRDGDCTCYVDGVLQTAKIDDLSDQSATLSHATDKPRIGSRDSGNAPFDGDISKFKYGLGLLTQAEVTADYNSGDGCTTAEIEISSPSMAGKLVHSLNLNEASAAEAKDSVGSNDANQTGTADVGATTGPEGADYLEVSDGDPVVSWTCRATGAEFTQATAASRPIFRAPGSAIGNKYGGIEFDGNAHYLAYTVAQFLGSSSSGHIFLVVEPDTTTSGYVFGSGDVASSTRFLGAMLSTICRINQRNDDTQSKIDSEADSIDANPYIVEISSTGSAYGISINNDTQSLAETEGSDNGDWFSGTEVRDNVTIGALVIASGVLNEFDGIISELLVYDGTVTAAERTALFNRLAAEYGITLA